MSARIGCALAATGALLGTAAPLLGEPLYYVYTGSVALVDADLTGTVWEGVSVGDAFRYRVRIDPDAELTAIISPNNKRYAHAILRYDVRIGSLTDSGVPLFPQQLLSGLRIVDGNSSDDVISSYVDTPTYDVGGQIHLEASTFDAPDIFTTPGTYASVASFQSFVALDDGFGGFINIDNVSLRVVPGPGAGVCLIVWLGAVLLRRRA